MNFQPLRDMIVVKPDQVNDKIGSVYVPQGSIKGMDQAGDYRDTGIGTVVAIGPGDRVHEKWIEEATQSGKKGMRMVRTLIHRDGSPAPMLTKVGDRVVFPRRPSGGEVEIDGQTYMMFNEQQNALAVIEE